MRAVERGGGRRGWAGYLDVIGLWRGGEGVKRERGRAGGPKLRLDINGSAVIARISGMAREHMNVNESVNQ